jgi:hypothetical protein
MIFQWVFDIAQIQITNQNGFAIELGTPQTHGLSSLITDQFSTSLIEMTILVHRYTSFLNNTKWGVATYAPHDPSVLPSFARMWIACQVGISKMDFTKGPRPNSARHIEFILHVVEFGQGMLRVTHVADQEHLKKPIRGSVNTFYT